LQILTDSGYSNVYELSGGFDAWVKAGYVVAGKQPISESEFTSITGHFTLDSKDTAGIPSTDHAWDKSPVLLALRLY